MKSTKRGNVLTSAMFVETITFRVPLSAASNTFNCSSVDKPAWRANGIRRVAPRGRLFTGVKKKKRNVGMRLYVRRNHFCNKL